MNLLRNPARPRQQGLVLFISLIVLVIMTLAAIAMVRSITASTQVANNLALRQGTTAAADVALESARQWLINTSNLPPPLPPLVSQLDTDSASNGYSSTNTVSPISPKDATEWRDNTNWVWVSKSCTPKPCTPAAMPQSTTAAAVANANGFSAAYLIQRSCSNSATAPSVVIDVAAASGNPCNLVKECPGCLKNKTRFLVNYLITVRIQGPKNTVSFYQASLY